MHIIIVTVGLSLLCYRRTVAGYLPDAALSAPAPCPESSEPPACQTDREPQYCRNPAVNQPQRLTGSCRGDKYHGARNNA